MDIPTVTPAVPIDAEKTLEPSAPVAPSLSPSSAATPATPDPKPTGPTSKDPADKYAKLRFQAKVAGALMMLLGSFFAFQFGLAAYYSSKPSVWAEQPGGDILADLGSPNIKMDLSYANGNVTQVQTGPDGTVLVHAQRAAFQWTAGLDNHTYVRNAIVPQNSLLNLTVRPGDVAVESVGLIPTIWNPVWIYALVPDIIAVGGYSSFRLRGGRLAMAGAFVFLAAAAYLMAFAFNGAFGGWILVGTAAICFFFIYRAKGLFAPLRRVRAQS